MKWHLPRSIRWKLWIGAVALVGIPLLILNQRYIDDFDRFTSKTLQLHMHNYASVAAEQYLLHSTPSPDDVRVPRTIMARQLDRLSLRTDSRIKIYSANSKVYYDSHPGEPYPVDIPEMPIEVNEAFGGGWSARSRLSLDKELYYYFLAQPIKDESKNLHGVVYIITHTGPIIQEIRGMIKRQRITLAVMLIIATAASLLLGWAVTHRLRMLIKAVRRHASGKANLNVHLRGKDELAELASALRNMSLDLDKRYIYNYEFVRELFHEIGNPVHAIQGAVDQLADNEGEKLTQTQRDELIITLQQSSSRIEKLTQELKKRSQLDADRVLGEKEEVDVEQFLTGVISRWETGHRRAHAAITLSPPESPISISLIPFRIEQVITNLLDNAIRHTPQSGKVSIKARLLRAKWLRIEVEDTGCGITASAIERVFDRFYTSDHNRDGGTGLGLDIARLFVLQHKGRISVDSVEGEGSAFYVDLPCS